ncbi:Sialic acid-binding lectin [Channa argus]|uniref:Sialic acid-binding lectin n=1 Tax=Channa argus TaxID=215402 RepID=A0A6G1PE14_CHAAH|nr:Sialic acid-binding lectin [Channa argus]
MRMQFACLLLMLLSVSAVNWLSFTDKHIIQDQQNGDCKIRMKHINRVYKTCKDINTFIVDFTGTVNNLCLGKYTGIVTSSLPYDLMICKGGGTFPNCRYNKQTFPAYIQIRCNNYQPEHYVGHSRRPGF